MTAHLWPPPPSDQAAPRRAASPDSDSANASGVLKLFCRDTFTDDNVGSVSATIALAPELASVALLLAGLGIVGGLARRRGKNLV